MKNLIDLTSITTKLSQHFPNEFDLFLGETYLGHYPMGVITPLANALSEAFFKVREAINHQVPLGAHRWNIREENGALLICKGDHEKHEGCVEFRYVPSTEADKWKLKYQTLMYQNLSDILDECDEHDWLRVALNPELSRINKLLTKDEKL